MTSCASSVLALTSVALNHNLNNFTNMDNTITFPKDLAEVIKTLPPLKELSYSPGTYRINGFKAQVPRSLMAHRRKFQRVVNKLYVIGVTKVQVKASDLLLKLKEMGDKPVDQAKLAALIKSKEVSKRPATPQEVEEYIRAEQKLTVWRLNEKAKEHTRTAKYKLREFNSALKAIELAKSLQAQADKHFDAASEAEELAVKYAWAE